jgi:cytochrome oxidase Cu insertion factor (SCO1/SenC/PrrC family)
VWAILAALATFAAPTALSVGDRLPPVTLVDQDGQRVRIDAFGGRTALLSFVSTKQASVTFCPAVTAKFLYLQQHLPSPDYRLVQITRDAATDTPQRLRRYATQFGARSSAWRFLTGSGTDIGRLITILGAGNATNGYEKLFAVSGQGEILGILPADDWSPADALAWAAALERGESETSATFSGQSAAAGENPVQARLTLTGSGLQRRLDLVEFDRSASDPFRSYVSDMTKLVHLVVVSDDLLDFQHVHPVLGADGHFRMTLAFPHPTLYHLYADARPAGHENGVVRFDVPIGSDAPGSRPSKVSSDEAHAGPYTVRVSALHVAARQDVPLLFAIQRNGLPATDLHPYLGAYAHVIAVGVSDLSYVHAHPMTPGMMGAGTMGMGGSSQPVPLAENATVPATMTVHVRLRAPGLYKVWIQFRGGAALFAAPFVIQGT